MTNGRTDGLCTDCGIHQKCRCDDEQASSGLSDLLCVGDINQGCGDNLEVIRVDGNADGDGLPDSFIIRDALTGETLTYTPEGA